MSDASEHNDPEEESQSDRVDWTAPWLATSQIVVCFVGMAVGVALGDILPGS